MEGPPQLILQFASGCYTQGAEKFPEVNVSIVVGIERSKHVLGKLRSIAVREEIAIDLFEFFYGQVARWTVLQEAFIPLLNLGLSEVGLLR